MKPPTRGEGFLAPSTELTPRALSCRPLTGARPPRIATESPRCPGAFRRESAQFSSAHPLPDPLPALSQSNIKSGLRVSMAVGSAVMPHPSSTVSEGYCPADGTRSVPATIAIAGSIVTFRRARRIRPASSATSPISAYRGAWVTLVRLFQRHPVRSSRTRGCGRKMGFRLFQRHPVSRCGARRWH